MMSIAHIALAGMHRAETRLAKSAHNVVEVSRFDLPAGISDGAAEQARGYAAYADTNRMTQPRSPLSGFLGSSAPHPPQDINLATEIADFTLASTSYKASLAVFKTADDLQKATLEILT